jgi:hypothetical protein
MLVLPVVFPQVIQTGALGLHKLYAFTDITHLDYETRELFV